MAAKGRGKDQKNQRSDAWLWPMALILVMGGWGQAVWMWRNVPPEGLVPLWLLVWIGVGVAGLTAWIHWFVRRWWPVAWLTMMAWAGVPWLNDLASGESAAFQPRNGWLYGAAPLFLLLLLGVGLSGVMMTLGWFTDRRWSGPPSRFRPLREGLWSGLFAVVCGWLLISRAFALIPVALLAGALILIEAFFLVRESPGG